MNNMDKINKINESKKSEPVTIKVFCEYKYFLNLNFWSFHVTCGNFITKHKAQISLKCRKMQRTVTAGSVFFVRIDLSSFLQRNKQIYWQGT